MEAVVFSGIQASGKTSFYKERFFRSHVLISLDQLHTRNKEKRFLELCLELQQPFVVDNTNPTREDRSKYVQLAKGRKFMVVGYHFVSSLADAMLRNEVRQGSERIPEIGVRATAKKLEPPCFEDGFDQLFFVTLENGCFQVEERFHEVR
ncbi:MAG: ATP-binding protein [Fibrobacterota bacterium]|nr:ATP-binding protein [Fibrobacterota bacterium]QQS03499.1 MAG: ATP-binding protein [Fibrobacterota bacterium]